MLGKRTLIGEWSVEPALDVLQRGGETVRLEPKAMELLVALSSRPGEVVSREELLSAVWPGVVVGDEALSQAVTKLRKALGDDVRAPIYIETISKRGYRLIASVKPLAGRPGAEIAAAPAPGKPHLRQRASLIGFLVALVAAGTYLWQSQHAASLSGSQTQEEPGADRISKLPTVTVTPFDSLSDDPAQVYLARGITADLATDLSRLAGLRVIGASRGRYLVSGSVQRAADHLKVNVRLTDSTTGQQLWSERYEKSLGDLFAVQDDIVARLVAALPVKLSEAERSRLARRYTRNLDAYDYFLRGQAALLTRTHEDNQTAREMYRKALARDTAFARAYAGLALTYAADYRQQWTNDGPQALTRAFELAETAARIAAEILEVQWVLAYVHTQSRRQDLRMADLNMSSTDAPSFSDADALLGNIYTYVCQPAVASPRCR